MSEIPPSPWVHIGECPVCVDGLCRVRTCVQDGAAHFYALCDECEALWLAPTTDSPHTFADASQPKCPICQQDLYGSQAHWALADELRGSAWMADVIFDVPDVRLVDPRWLSGGEGDASCGQDDSQPEG